MAFPKLHIASVEIPGPPIVRLHCVAVYGNGADRRHTDVPVRLHEPGAALADRRLIVIAQVGNRLVVGNQPASKPRRLYLAILLPFQPTAPSNPVHLPIDEELQ